MATITKLIHISLSSGVKQSAKLYTTPGEAGNPNLPLTVDGATVYAVLINPASTTATNGRVRLSNGTVYAIGTEGAPPYAYQIFTSNGTFTVPAGVSRIRVTCVGGGAGGMIASGNHTVTGFGGEPTVFGSVTGAGATPATVTIAGGKKVSQTKSKGFYGAARVNGSGTTHQGYGGQPAVPLCLIDGTEVHKAGAGGYADGDGHYVFTGAAGFRTIKVIDSVPGQAIKYIIGMGGAMCDNNEAKGNHNTHGHGGAPGEPGAILVEYGQGIT